MGNVLETSGIDAAISRYRELRKEHYGSSSYDFGETPLNRLGEAALRAGKSPEASRFSSSTPSSHRESAWLLQLLGEAYLASGDRDGARAS
ncbi:MAG: hypothetical protein ACRD21_19150, partial [Vicinamibacteria bacterium]